MPIEFVLQSPRFPCAERREIELQGNMLLTYGFMNQKSPSLY